MNETSEYEKLALETGAYRDIELEILKEALAAWKAQPGSPYVAAEVRDGRVLAGFGLLCRAANTEFTFDALALCVEPGYADKGVGKRLIQLLEEEVLRLERSAILRFETSTRKAESMGRGLLLASGYALIGHIADFYEKGDDYFIYARHLARPRPEKPEGKDSLPPGEGAHGKAPPQAPEAQERSPS
jgi:GNAT superfamily N-acetyltransferase